MKYIYEVGDIVQLKKNIRVAVQNGKYCVLVLILS